MCCMDTVAYYVWALEALERCVTQRVRPAPPSANLDLHRDGVLARHLAMESKDVRSLRTV